MSANLASETNFYIDFEPITFCQLIKKTLYLLPVFSSQKIMLNNMGMSGPDTKLL